MVHDLLMRWKELKFSVWKQREGNIWIKDERMGIEGRK